MLAVMFIDLDQFKEINDLYDHEAGDNVLKQIAERLVACVRESDTVARLGGDEFVILLPIIKNESDAMLVANKIVAAVIKPITIAASPDSPEITLTQVYVSASIGVTMYPQHGKDEKLLIINADMAMYQAKKNGKNQAKLFDTAMLK